MTVDALDDLPVDLDKTGRVRAVLIPSTCPVGQCSWDVRGSLLGSSRCASPEPGVVGPCLVTTICRVDPYPPPPAEGRILLRTVDDWPGVWPRESDLSRLRGQVPDDAPTVPLEQNHVAVADGAPSTSVEAAARAFPGTGTLRRRVVDAILVAEYSRRVGLTDDEIEAAIDRPHQSVSAARNALVRDGWLEDSGVDRDTRSGSPANVWRLTTGARKELAL